MTQKERIIDYINTFGSITSAEAFTDLGIMRLASRISDLRQEGYTIFDKMVGAKNRYGEKVSFKRYAFSEEGLNG